MHVVSRGLWENIYTCNFVECFSLELQFRCALPVLDSLGLMSYLVCPGLLGLSCSFLYDDEVSFYTLFRAFEKLLEDIYVTCAHLEKKRKRLQLYTKIVEEYGSQWLETASQFLATALECKSDGIRT
ncbi:hypothetical protein Tco_1234133 [Tanacetum coccineum]